MSSIFPTTLRFHLDKEEDRTAFAYLQGIGKAMYGSYSKAVVAAVNDYFSRMERLNVDPYLETREKEDAFLRRVQESIQRELQASAVANLSGLAALLRGAPPLVNGSSIESDAESEEDLNAAAEFIAGL